MVRRRQKKEIIPKKVQIPLMVVGLAVFIWRAVVVLGPLLGGGDVVAPTPAKSPSVKSVSPRSTDVLVKKAIPVPSGADELRVLLSELESVRDMVTKTRGSLSQSRKRLAEGLDVVRASRTLSPLEKDPFSGLPADIWVSSAPTLAQGEKTQARSSRLRDVVLQGTLLTGGDALAIIGGEVVREGDIVNGFLVEKIEESGLTLHDGEGSVLLQMEGTEN